MSRLTGTNAAQHIDNAQGAQRTAGAKFKEFFVAIGKGFQKAGNAIAHFFGTSVPNFFKSLGQRNAVQVQTTDRARSGSLGESTSEGTTTAPSTGVRGSATTGPTTSGGKIDNLDWTRADNFSVKDSGHGGVVVANVGAAKVAVKQGGGLTGHEVLGARLARALGLSAPETREMSSTEASTLKGAMRDAGAKFAARSDGASDPTIVMEFVEDAALLGDKPVAKQENANKLAHSLGKWLAFDALIGEQDRFHGFVSPGGYGINTGNFLVSSKNPTEIIGIDQNVMPGDTSKAISSIVKGDDMFFMNVGNRLADKIGGRSLDFEAMGDHVKAGAQEMFRHIGNTLNADAIAQLGEDLSFSSDVMTALSSRLDEAEKFAALG